MIYSHLFLFLGLLLEQSSIILLNIEIDTISKVDIDLQKSDKATNQVQDAGGAKWTQS